MRMYRVLSEYVVLDETLFGPNGPVVTTPPVTVVYFTLDTSSLDGNAVLK